MLISSNHTYLTLPHPTRWNAVDSFRVQTTTEILVIPLYILYFILDSMCVCWRYEMCMFSVFSLYWRLHCMILVSFECFKSETVKVVTTLSTLALKSLHPCNLHRNKVPLTWPTMDCISGFPRLDKSYCSPDLIRTPACMFQDQISGRTSWW